MGRLVAPLSDRKVKAAKPKEKVYRLSDGNGLVLEVKPNGTKVWRVRYTYQKRARTYTIGEYPIVSLANARAEAMEVRELLLKGIDPVEHRRAKSSRDASRRRTLKDVAEEFFEAKKVEWAPTHFEKQIRRAEIYIYPAIGHRLIADVTKADIVRIVKDVPRIVTPTTKMTAKHDVAKRVFYLLRQIWRYALHHDYIERDIPATIDISQIIPRSDHRPMPSVTDEDEICRIFSIITDDFRGYGVMRYALEFLALTALRPGNIRNLRWEWVDTGTGLIVYPPEAMKGKREFRLPLTQRLIEIIEATRELTGDRSEYVFCSPTSPKKMLSDAALGAAHKRLGITDHTAHGWRSSFSTICYERQRDHGFSAEVIEAQLHHAIGNRVVRAYMRSDFLDERRELLEWWGRFLRGG